MENEPLGHEYETELEAKLGVRAARSRLPMAPEFDGDITQIDPATAVPLLVNWVGRLAYEVDRLSGEVEQLRRGGP